MKFDVVLTNPPFQDRTRRGKTRHKLWIDFTQRVFDDLLVDGGLLCQVSPASFRSPSNSILDLFRKYRVHWVRFDTDHHFPDVAVGFSDYLLEKTEDESDVGRVTTADNVFEVRFDSELFYLPNRLNNEAISIHRKVIFETQTKLPVERDYVTCHNILLKRSNTLSKEKTDRHVYPVFHTNNQIWFSSIQQDFASELKVMWTRSGYTKPFFDRGTLGCTDMAYFVRVPDEQRGKALAHNLNLSVFRYIYRTAKWSGFGNERVFDALPAVPFDTQMTDEELFSCFGLTEEEIVEVKTVVG